MTGSSRGTYGIGCITIKQTNPRGDSYVYAEWYVDGKRRSKSCGKSTKPESHRRARALLREALEERIEALKDELTSLRRLEQNAETDRVAGGSDASEPPPGTAAR